MDSTDFFAADEEVTEDLTFLAFNCNFVLFKCIVVYRWIECNEHDMLWSSSPDIALKSSPPFKLYIYNFVLFVWLHNFGLQ